MSARIGRYWHTLRHLRLQQITGRLWFKVYRPRVELGRAPPLGTASGRWQPPARRRASIVGQSRFDFLNAQRAVESPDDWDRFEWPRLWRYNLHYFDDLNAQGAERRTAWHRALIARWIVENPPASGTGWEPYPTSLRIVNWIKWSLDGHALEPEWQESLAIQSRWLRKRLEWHLLGNHLFVNAKAMVFAGTFFSDDEAETWLAAGLRILDREITEQILADGGQFERSPLYHALALEDVLDLVNLAQAYPGRIPQATVDQWRATAAGMLGWLNAMTHPDGTIVLFNDAAFGIAPDPNEIDGYAARLGVTATSLSQGVTYLKDTGYVRIEAGPAMAFLDVAPIGPDYMPGHGHADTLTFELSLFGERWIVDSGCSTYEVGPERLRQRGTAAHNTVVVDDADSSEVWGGFRVARRAGVSGFSLSGGDEHIGVAASHDGYLRLSGRVTHTRSWTLSPTALEIVDDLTGRYRSAVARILLHPDVEVTQRTAQLLELRRDKHMVAIALDTGTAQVESATWHPEFGISLETHRIRIDFATPHLATRLTW